MHLPSHYDEVRAVEIHRLMREHPLGALVTNGPNCIDANHIPFEFAVAQGAKGMLRAHVARANPVWAGGV